MNTYKVVVGTEVKQLANLTLQEQKEGYVIEIFVYNNSANTVYIGNNSDLSTDSGIPISANGHWSGDREIAVYVVASGAGSDVRVKQRKRKERVY